MHMPMVTAVLLLTIASSLGLNADPPAPNTPPATPPVVPPSPPPTEPKPSKPDEDPEKIKVWATPSGKKYHKSTCRYAKGASPITLKEARAKGLSACKTCGGY